MLRRLVLAACTFALVSAAQAQAQTYRPGVAPGFRAGFQFLSQAATGACPNSSLAYYDFVANTGCSAGTNAANSVANLTVSRASIGYDLAATTQFAANVARRTGAGLLVEGAATNLWKQSRDFTTAQYTTNGFAVAKTGTSADGATGASRLTMSPTGGTNTTRWYNTTALGTTLNRSYSFYYKSNGSVRYIHLRIQGDKNYVALIDTVNNSYLGAGFYDSNTAGAAPTSASVAPAGNGWYRVSVYILSSSTTGSFPLCYYSTSATTTTTTWAGTEYIDMDHVQVEDGVTFASSPADTTTSSATRAADNITLTLPSGTTKVDLAYDNTTTNTVTVSAGSYTIPANPAGTNLKSLRAY